MVARTPHTNHVTNLTSSYRPSLRRCRSNPRLPIKYQETACPRSAANRFDQSVSWSQWRHPVNLIAVNVPSLTCGLAPKATDMCNDPCTCSKSRYSITSSARPSSVIGNVRPSVFAVLRLMSSSIFVNCCTGRSAGFSPLRMRPV